MSERSESYFMHDVVFHQLVTQTQVEFHL